MKFLIPSFVAFLAFGTAANASVTTAGKPLFQLPNELVSQNNEFAIDLYRECSRYTVPVEPAPQVAPPPSPLPLFFSPYSISTALAMTYAGARGSTAAEMAKTLHFTLPADKLAATYGAAMKQLTAEAPAHGYQFRIANRLWGQAGYAFAEPFLKITRNDFGAPLGRLDFMQHTEQARTTINAWVADETSNKIKNLIGPGDLDAATRLVLTNAIYFKGDWALPFDKKSTHPAHFHVNGGENFIDVAMMNQQSRFRFARTADATFLELPYKGADLSMVVMLPAKVDGLPALEKSFTARNYAAWIEKLSVKQVSVWLPKIRATQEMQLSDTLAVMGMASVFSATKADFSGMDGTRRLYISRMIHKAYLDVDENGAEAAAATATVMGGGAFHPEAPEEFKADHPFMYLLRDTRSGAILFMGRYLGTSLYASRN